MIDNVVGVMDGAEKALTAISNVDTDLGQLRDTIDGVISTTTQTADSLRPGLAHIQHQIDKLGEPPANGAPPESPTVATERSRLTAQASEISGAPGYRQDHQSPAAAVCAKSYATDGKPALPGILGRSRERSAER